MQDRERECGGFVRSGLGNADHIAVGHHRLYRLYLDRGRSEVFFFREGTRDCVVKSEVMKRGQRESFLLCALPQALLLRRAGVCG